MNRREILRWTRRWHGPAVRPILPDLVRQVALLSRASAQGVFSVEFFEAALNSETLYDRVKLVHVAQFLENLPAARKHALALRRRESLRELFEGWGLDTAPLERLYDRVSAAGITEFYPVASVEWDLRARRFEEVSLYCEPRAAEVAAAIGRGLKLPRGRLAAELDLKRVFAVGYDFRPGRPSRFKLYHAYPVSAGRLRRFDSARHYFTLPRRFWPKEYLVLRRKAEGEPFENTRKVYLPFLNRRLPTDGTTVFGLAGAARAGLLRKFLGAIRDSAEGQCLDYMGAEGDRIELYFGKPSLSWVRAAAWAGQPAQEKPK